MQFYLELLNVILADYSDHRIISTIVLFDFLAISAFLFSVVVILPLYLAFKLTRLFYRGVHSLALAYRNRVAPYTFPRGYAYPYASHHLSGPVPSLADIQAAFNRHN